MPENIGSTDSSYGVQVIHKPTSVLDKAEFSVAVRSRNEASSDTVVFRFNTSLVNINNRASNAWEEITQALK